MQVSINAKDATMNVRSRQAGAPERSVPSVMPATGATSATSKGGVDPKRQSIRLIDFGQEHRGHVEFAHYGIYDDPFSSPNFEGLPQALLDVEKQPRDPFDLTHLKPPPQFSKGSSNNSASQSTPSLPIAVASRASGSERSHPSDLSTSSDHATMSPSSMRLSSSADSALAALPPPPPPPGQIRLPDSDEIDACGCSDHPNLPPRVALQPPDRPRILPIVENGQRTSYTHYWVIPPRMQNARFKHSVSTSPHMVGGTVALSPNQTSVSMDNEAYVNLNCPPLVTRSASMPPRTRPKERRYVKRPSGDATDETDHGCATNRAFVDDVLESAPMTEIESALLLDSSFSQQQQMASSVDSDSSWETLHQSQQTRMVPSAEERKARIIEVRESVHGVTDEEAQMILQTHRWEVEQSILLLKVEQLFRLGVTPSKEYCKKILDGAGGDLELASHRLIHQQSAAPTLSTTSK